MSRLEFSFPRVQLGPDFAQRAQRLAQSFAARRSRETLALGAARRAGGGDELVGHRPLRAGEDARDLDLELYARLERAFVRERRAEAGERWAIVLDSSRSMGVGSPSKLQCAAEIALALAACGLRCGARVELVTHAAGPVWRAEAQSCARPIDWLRCVRWLDGRAVADHGRLTQLCAHPRVAAARRVFVLGDLFDAQPAQLLALARPGRFVTALAILAAIELAPPHSGAVLWVDPEDQQRLALRLDDAVCERYAGALRAALEQWARSFARHGQAFAVCASERAFEEHVRAAL